MFSKRSKILPQKKEIVISRDAAEVMISRSYKRIAREPKIDGLGNG